MGMVILHKPARPSFPGLQLPSLTFALILLLSTFHEWVTIGLIADSVTIAGYPFGSEEATSNGA